MSYLLLMKRLLTDVEIETLFSTIEKGFDLGEIQFITTGFSMSIFGRFSLENELTFHRKDGHSTQIDLATLKVYAPYLRIAGHNKETGETRSLTTIAIRQE